MTYPTHAELVVRLRARPSRRHRARTWWMSPDDGRPGALSAAEGSGAERARLFDQNGSDVLKRMQADAVAEADGLLSYDDVARFEDDAEPRPSPLGERASAGRH